MNTTRRRFARLLSGSIAAAGFVSGFPVLARGDRDGPPNVFFSPHGRPYRAPDGAAYPVADWFKDADHKGEGKIDRDAFIADAAAFFDVLDVNGDGALDAGEISLYEHEIAPEVLGMRVRVYANGLTPFGPRAPRLWLAQYDPMEGPISEDSHNVGGLSGNPGHGRWGDQDHGGVLPQDVRPNSPDAPSSGVDLAGAAPYGLLGEPEPVTAADPGYLISGVVKKAAFLAHAGENFSRLDRGRRGYLTLASLPQSPVQAALERLGRGR
jgi:hypothetical protein